MQNQNRAGGDANGGGGIANANAVAGGSSTAASTGASGGERRGSSTFAARPPSISARPGFSDALVPGGEGGGGNPSTPDSGAAFNLLGLPPSPAPRSGVTGASAWGATMGGGIGGGGSMRGVGDVMAGQVCTRSALFGGGGTWEAVWLSGVLQIITGVSVERRVSHLFIEPAHRELLYT